MINEDYFKDKITQTSEYGNNIGSSTIDKYVVTAKGAEILSKIIEKNDPDRPIKPLEGDCLITCPKCFGKGKVKVKKHLINYEKCPVCNGKGFIKKE